MALFPFRIDGGAHPLSRAVIGAAAVVVTIDQISKAVALRLLADVDRSFGPFRFTLVRNPGGPFGLADEASLIWTGMTAAILVAVVAFLGRLDVRPALAVGAVLGGGVGNFLDRLLRQPGAGRGAVIDWISLEPYPRVFNLADLALRVGTAIVIVMMWVGRPEATTVDGDVDVSDSCSVESSPVRSYPNKAESS